MRAFGAVVLIGAWSAAGFAAQLTLPASVDGAVQYNGTLGYTVVDNATNATLMSGGNNVRDSIYEFDLGALPSGATITGATLYLTTAGLVSNTSSLADITFYGYTGDGAITDNDHGNLTAATQVGLEQYATGGSGVAIGTELAIALSTVAPLQAAYDDLASDWFAIRTETVNFVTFTVHSLENTESTDVDPKLVIDYVPEPASLSLLGLSALWLLRRR